MKPKALVSCCVGLLLLLTVLLPVSQAAVPHQINYQGYLTDSSGNPVPDGDYEMSFAIYDASTDGNLLWGESQTVTVTNGIYNVILGQPTNPIDPGIINGDRYLGVTVGGDAEMIPRQKITATAFALKAAMADSVVNGAVTSVMIADGAVDASKVADNAITSTKIVDHTVTAADIQGGSGSGLDSDTLDGLEGSYYASAAQLNTLQETVTALQSLVTTLQNENQQLKDKLQYVSVVGNEMYITGANLHVRSGSGATNGTVNGLGNVIIGYNETRDWYSCSLGNTYQDQTSCEDAGGQWWLNNKTGSHNLVVGYGHNYDYYGGIVAGSYNTISSIYTSVSGGRFNTASGHWSSVSGGSSNTASDYYASVSGGSTNTASGHAASVSGGHNNSAIGNYSSVSGGGSNNPDNGNVAYANYSSILGGILNITGDADDPTVGERSTISGGDTNIAIGTSSTVSGGVANHAIGGRSTVSGGAGLTESAYQGYRDPGYPSP